MTAIANVPGLRYLVLIMLHVSFIVQLNGAVAMYVVCLILCAYSYDLPVLYRLNYTAQRTKVVQYIVQIMHLVIIWI